ncbi:GNAT family N-acetyltransferase [Nesterenkonia sp. MY13]|uniref:GNAT family N-acetyltransferase n=1 Tax=Nesterenkonia sedimenti TaxID=1463632 RepID=A0A7X8TL64_9MICC|nr:DUF4081 domain-containing GNAT family N-acetyltransferase [Nesterenkonia sedimenti]NLS10606.1 GNAT family N-acetyltransferase [Nesterenkonia sedimenti]
MPLWSPSASADSRLARATDGAVRVLTGADTHALHQLLEKDLAANVTVTAAVRQRGTAERGKGRDGALLLGIDNDGASTGGQLASACWVGSNIIPVGADAESAELYGAAARALRRRVSSIYGRADAVLSLFEATGWGNHREVRAEQPLMTITGGPQITPLQGVRRSRIEEFPAVERACAAMFAEELGFSPYDHGASQYRARIRGLIKAGHSLVAVDPETRQITFKAEFGAVTDEVIQIQGVWVNPDWRGQGLAAPGMAAVVERGLQLAPMVSLYVNSWNTAAIRAYERVGFQRDGTYATVLF